MLRKTLKAIGWTAAGLVALCVVAYLGVLAINWRDREPNATAVRFARMFRDRPTVADEDNAYVYLRGWELDRDRDKKRSARLREFLEACRPGQRICPGAFDTADGLFEEWQSAENPLLDRYLTFSAHAGWFEVTSFTVAESIPAYSGASDGQKLLLLYARDSAMQGDAAAVRTLLERDLRFWRTVLQSSDILISKMVATAALNRHFEWGYRILRKLPSDQITAAIPDGWRNGISDAERSMTRCMVGEWMFTSEMLQQMDTSQFGMPEDLTTVERILNGLARPMFQLQDTKNRTADHYWEVARTFNVPLDQYEDALRRADELTERTTDLATAFQIYNFVGVLSLINLDSFSDYAARVSDIEGVRRAALLAATLRATSIETRNLPSAVASAELRSPYTDRPFDWDEANGAIVFRGLERSERREHRVYY
jgi:hypothetical protein